MWTVSRALALWTCPFPAKCVDKSTNLFRVLIQIHYIRIVKRLASDTELNFPIRKGTVSSNLQSSQPRSGNYQELRAHQESPHSHKLRCGKKGLVINIKPGKSTGVRSSVPSASHLLPVGMQLLGYHKERNFLGLAREGE